MSCSPSPPQPLTLSLEPTEGRGEKTSPAGFPGSGGKRGPDFKTTGLGVETEAPILGLRIPLTRTWCDWREAETAGRLRRGWGRKASPESQPPRARARSEAASLAFWSPCPCHIRGCGFTVVGHQRAGDLRLVTGCSQSPYPYVTLGHFLGWASVSPSVKWSRQNLVPFWNSWVG